MSIVVTSATLAELTTLREQYRREMQCQIVHDSLHHRAGWTISHRLTIDGAFAGYGSIAVGGPWQGKPTVFEFHVTPEHRSQVFDLFEALLKASGARFLEVQTNSILLTMMAHTYGRDLTSEKIVFADGFTANLQVASTTVRSVTPKTEVQEAIRRRHGGSEFVLELQGRPVGRGGLAFHYNEPYADLYMSVDEPFRGRGLGAYLVQELKRICRELDHVPCARCDPNNVASRRTLQKAGFVPVANILKGTIVGI